ncbi:MAG: hypothetical protein FJZ58_06720 [Chlamydiae bacterium]|nr:hypothetical protein [Chlamydiota bacterium]
MIRFEREEKSTLFFWQEELVAKVAFALTKQELTSLLRSSSQEILLLTLQEIEESKGKKTLLRLLGQRPLFIKQAQDKLLRQGISPQVVERVVVFAKQQGLLCDETVTEITTRSTLRKGKGLRTVQHKVHPWSYLAPTKEEREQERQALAVLIEKKGIIVEGLSLQEKYKWANFFWRRGFSSESIQRVLFLT